MRVPASTYRIQFTPTFGFRDAARVVRYLHGLGISHLYASPIFAAGAGSTHGYDVVDPNRLNPELGTAHDHRELLDMVRGSGMGWIQDIVPNHMAFDSRNAMLMDVLENGEASRYIDFFDIEWNHPNEDLSGRVLAPHLGRFFGECLDDGEISLAFDVSGLSVNYYDLRLPLRLESYPEVLARDARQLESVMGKDNPDRIRFMETVEILRSGLPPADSRERREQVGYCKETLRALYQSNPDIRGHVDGTLRLYNGQKGVPASFTLLDELLGKQLFRLSFWKVATEEINYRRFFNINQLISMRVERDGVFRETHSMLLKSVWQGDYDGLRVDHVDGLYNPAAYLQRLRDTAPEAYIVVEKILEPQEELPVSWPVAGTSGYDYLNIVNGLLCDPAGMEGMERSYRKFTGMTFGYEELVASKKRLIIGRLMAGDVDRLALLLKHIAGRDRHARDVTLYGLRRALVELLALFPVYRTYVAGQSVGEADRNTIQHTVEKARQTNPALALELNFIRRFLLLEFPPGTPEGEKEEWVDFVMRFQQLSGPLMAKGFEDTTLYIYHRLVSLNDVGGSPDRFGLTVDQFHESVARRASAWPATMNATSTHDTKRGEDVRARLNVLSEIPDEWEARVTRWREVNRGHLVNAGERDIPDANDQYLLYQTILGAYPFDGAEVPGFIGRIQDYMIKAVREAKRHTAWLKPDGAYENGVREFVTKILDPVRGKEFLEDFLPFQKRVAHFGMLNALSQVLLKAASPGVPDFYQGSELWDLNLVDPDNRRPVDFDRRIGYLDEISRIGEGDRSGYIAGILGNAGDGRIKLFTTYCALAVRAARGDLFTGGEYIPLKVGGAHAGRAVAFARRSENSWALVVAPIRTVALVPEGRFPLGAATWADTAIELPEGFPWEWRNAFTGAGASARESSLAIAEICPSFPVGLLTA
jgi:(1->4)-alpha-D-glucan 1-alpha-D-glucosylmutase